MAYLHVHTATLTYYSDILEVPSLYTASHFTKVVNNYKFSLVTFKVLHSTIDNTIF